MATDITTVGRLSNKELRNDINSSFEPQSDDDKGQTKKSAPITPTPRIHTPRQLDYVYEGPERSPILEQGNGEYFGSSRYDPNTVNSDEWRQMQENPYELRAQNQPWYAKLGAGVLKGVGLAATTFIDGTVGLIVGLESIPSKGIEGIWNNSVSNTLQDFNKDMEQWLPNYRTQEEIERPWYQNIGTMNFWADGVLKNLGFTVGAFYSGGAWNKALKSIGWLKKSVTAQGVGSFLSAFNEGRIEANNAQREFMEGQEAQIKQAKDMRALEILESDLDDFTKETLLQQLNDNADQLLADARERSQGVGLTTLIGNTALLTATNLWEFGKLYGRGFENANSLAKGTIKEAGKYRWNNISKGQAALKGASNGLTEGFEEMNQALISETAGYMQVPDSPDAYYQALLDPDAKIQTNDFMSSLAKGFVNTYGNGDRWEEFAIGALTGLLGMPTFGKVQNSDNNTYLGQGRAIGLSKGILGEMRQARMTNIEGQENVDAMNKYLDKFENQVNHFAQSQSFTNTMDGWAAANNKFEFQNASNNEDFSAIARFAKAGKLQDLKELVNQDFESFDEERLREIAAFTTPEMLVDEEGDSVSHSDDGSSKTGGWRNIDGSLMSDSEEGRETMKEELIKKRDKILKEIDRYEESVRKIRAIGNNSLNEDRVENLAWLDWKIGAFEDRYHSLKGELTPFFNKLSKRINDFIQLNSEPIVSEEDMISSPGKQPDESLEEYRDRLIQRARQRQQTIDLNTKEGQNTLKNLQTVLEYIDAVKDSDTALKMSTIIDNNPELLEYIKNDAYGNALLEDVSGFDHTTFQSVMKDIGDMGNLAKITKTFQETLKDYIDNPINEIKNRSKVEEKVRKTIDDRKSKRNKDISDSIARRIDFDGSTMSIAKALNDNAKDIEKVGGIDAWSKNLTDDQRKKVKKAQSLLKGINSLKDQIDGSEEIDNDRLKRLAKQFIDEAAQGATNIEEIENNANKLLNESSLDDKIRQSARSINDLETEKTIAETKNALKKIFDDSFERIKKDVAEMDKIEAANMERERKEREQANKISEKEGNPKVPTEPAEPGSPLEKGTKVPNESRIRVPQETNVTDKQMRDTNNKTNGPLETVNPKEYNRPQLTEAYLHGYDKLSYEEFITLHPTAIPSLNGATTQEYKKAINKIYTYLKERNAFDYIKEGLKVDDVIEFFVDENLNNEADTFVVLMRAIDAQGKSHVIGSMPTEIDFNSISKIAIEDESGNPTGEYAIDVDGQTLAQRNPERYKLFQDIKKLYEEDDKKSVDTSYFSTKVDKLMGGSLPLSNRESSVASIFENTGHTPIIAIANQDGKITSYNQDIDDAILGSDFQTEGQVYILLESNNGSYVPALTYSKPLIDLVKDSEHLSDDWYINQIIDKLQKATTELNIPNSVYDQELYKWLRLPGLSARFKYREKNAWIDDTSKNLENATHLVLNFDDDEGKHRTVSIPLKDKEITREDASKTLKEALSYSKKVTTNVITGQLNGPNREEYTNNISAYLYTNIIAGETHTINDWFTYKYTGDKPNRKRMKNEGQKAAGKTGFTKDPSLVEVDGKTYVVEGDYVTRDDGTLVEVGTEEYNRVMHPENQGLSPLSLGHSIVNPDGTFIAKDKNGKDLKIGDNIKVDGKDGYQKITDIRVFSTPSTYTLFVHYQEGDSDKAEYTNLVELVDEGVTTSNSSESTETKSTSQQLSDMLSKMADTNSKTATKHTTRKKAKKFLRVEDIADTTATTKQIQKDIDNVKRLFPELSKEGRIVLVNGIIRTIDEKGNPVEAYGEFKDGVLYISDASPKGSAFHESFHYIVDMLLDNNETEEMFKAAELEFKNTDRMALEEQLAERFRDYMNGMMDPSIKGILKRIFAKLKHIIDSIKSNTNYLDNLFYNIYSKKMVTKNPSNNQSSMQTDTVEMQQIKDQAIANGTFMKAPNGNSTNLTERQWLQVRTKAFKDWFGDWENNAANASKVVDENGEPLVVYHGSTKRFTTFDTNKVGSTTGDTSGFYFTNDRDIAKQYYSKETGSTIGNLKLMFGIGGKSTVYDVFLKAFNPYVENFNNSRDTKGRESIIKNAKEQGHDAVILKNIIDGPSVVQDAYVVFNPNQIKSATDNVGTFSRENNNIYDFKEALSDYKYRKTDYANLDEDTKNYLKERGITEEVYQALSAEQREYILHCM